MKIEYGYYPQGREKALTMSYDDGHIHDRRLVEIFNKYGIKGTFHINSGLFGQEHIVSAMEVKELYRGHEVSGHTLMHPYMNLLSKEMLIYEVLEDKRNLERLVGYPVRGMSYPYGVFDDTIVESIRMLGMEYSRTCIDDPRFSIPRDFLRWSPTCHHDRAMSKLEYFQDPEPWVVMPLFYVWGHSFEFYRNNNNWETIEAFCKAVSYDDNVWYATNIEIKDYITALRGLVFSADRTIIYNPSGISVWLSVDKEPLEIKPVQTVTLS